MYDNISELAEGILKDKKQILDLTVKVRGEEYELIQQIAKSGNFEYLQIN